MVFLNSLLNWRHFCTIPLEYFKIQSSIRFSLFVDQQEESPAVHCNFNKNIMTVKICFLPSLACNDSGLCFFKLYFRYRRQQTVMFCYKSSSFSFICSILYNGHISTANPPQFFFYIFMTETEFFFIKENN